MTLLQKGNFTTEYTERTEIFKFSSQKDCSFIQRREFSCKIYSKKCFLSENSPFLLSF